MTHEKYRDEIIESIKNKSKEVVIKQDPVEVKEEIALAPKKSRRSWKPANLVEIPNEFKEPGWRYYCVDKRTIRLAQKLREGYVIDKNIVPKMRNAGMIDDQPSTLQDGHPKDNTLTFRELLVLKIREEDAQSRDEYFQNENPLNKKLQEEDDSFHRDTGGRTYGDIKLK